MPRPMRNACATNCATLTTSEVRRIMNSTKVLWGSLAVLIFSSIAAGGVSLADVTGPDHGAAGAVREALDSNQTEGRVVTVASLDAEPARPANRADATELARIRQYVELHRGQAGRR